MGNAHERDSLLLVCVKAKSFSSQLRPSNHIQERTMIEQNRVISAPVPRGPQITLPAGDGRQITSHPYAECKCRCHPCLRYQPVITCRREGVGWAINKEKERLMGCWSTPSWSKEIHITACSIPNRDRCYEAAQPRATSSYLMEFLLEQQSRRRAISARQKLKSGYSLWDLSIKIVERSCQSGFWSEMV